jgi:putative transposase
VGYDNAALKQHFFDQTQTQGKSKMQPDGVCNDLGRKSVAFVTDGTRDHPPVDIIRSPTKRSDAGRSIWRRLRPPLEAQGAKPPRKQRRPPKRIITDKLRSYSAARREIMPNTEHRQHKGLNNRAENSHVPVRKRERMMQGFRSWSGLQRFVSTFSAVRNHFVPPRSQRSAISTHLHRLRAMAEWKSVTAVAA